MDYDKNDLEAFFKARDMKIDSSKKALENARRNSVNASRTERKTKQVSVDLGMIAAKIIAVLLSGVIVVTGIKAISDSINSPLDMTNLSREIGSIVYTVDENFNERFDSTKVSIVSQNTHRNSNGPWYDQEDIAKDLLKLDSRLFDYAFCTVCDEMGRNINNPVGAAGRSNIDTVIYFLKENATKEDSPLYSPYVASQLNGVNSLEDYLKLHGYVNKDGEPSLEQFKKVSNENAQNIYDILEGNTPDKGGSLR